ncbi:Cyanuric acid amidohydrolase [Bradyrhizobium sp. ORS 375]|uniref:Cyanuric acid amidohydrolase n=1 Tax=Bradyrhizobium sp. (strain ORS 375) TaxID=566679 RepID=CAH_BRAS3|nr:ring-opening amidohydrolase [Bradyrhizobium sp. ORS 375]H0SH23.1 RecName: Full=Cyanuric acid amidohydrolase; Short=CAH [Bradyrhizobium sp. ORS 375]CCD93500.1 Cyanuric acid amidohydrolase [Bradyrhizobium sp. ORS 375]
MPTTLRRAHVHRLPMRSPDDVAALEAAITQGTIDPAGIVAILGKTEGNGCVNDFTRAFAVRSLEALLGRHLATEAVRQIAMVMSGGTEGALSPHMIVFEAREVDEGHAPRAFAASLALGRARTPVLPSEHLGRMQQVAQVAAGVRAAMNDAGITDAGDVHYVQVKCPLLTMERIEAAEARGVRTAVRDTLKSMGFSRGASALGVAVALGELAMDELSDTEICTDYARYSERAATSGGVELLDHEIMVAGMSRDWTGPLAIDHGVMRDAIDIEPARAALARLGLDVPGQLPAAARGRIAAVLAKAEAAQSGKVRDVRHTMLDDSDVSSTRHARAFVGGALAGLFGFTDLFVSGGAEHQGPDGGGPVAIIVERT